MSNARIIDQADFRQGSLPDEMRILLDTYPREAWDAHPNFKAATKQWLRAHEMFRRVSASIRNDAEKYLDDNLDAHDYRDKLAYRGNALVGSLHGHHGWEDHEYFPELSAADPRFDRGLDILEQDHQILDKVLHQFTEAALETINLIDDHEHNVKENAGNVLEGAKAIQTLLQRHLVDEEELAVPIIIHHKLRG